MSQVLFVDCVGRLIFHNPKPHLSCQKWPRTVHIFIKEDVPINELTLTKNESHSTFYLRYGRKSAETESPLLQREYKDQMWARKKSVRAEKRDRDAEREKEVLSLSLPLHFFALTILVFILSLKMRVSSKELFSTLKSPFAFSFFGLKRWNHSGCGLPLPADQRSTRNGHQSLRPDARRASGQTACFPLRGER